ncbi:MAG: nucleotidyltransferase domain-containing protein [Ktedonobacteraceae bacterium]
MKPSERFELQSNEKMSADIVVHLLQLFKQHGISVVIDGGWGVDALLGTQTRVHADLDIALEHKDVPMARSRLCSYIRRHYVSV